MVGFIFDWRIQAVFTKMTLQEKADRIFSTFIRVSYADFQGYVHCFTCEECLHWKQAQCGHWLRRWFGATRYHEDNCRPQCQECNEFRGGMEEAFEEALRSDIGDERVDALIALSKKHDQYTDDDYREIIKTYGLILKEKYHILI